MDSKYLVFDVETANDYFGSVCQVGLVFLDENFNEIKEKRFGELIDPEDEFEYIFHVSKHGIDEDVIRKYHPETFDKFWNKYSNEFLNNTIVFHANSNFDLNCIKAEVERYNLDFDVEKLKYIDTQKWIMNLTNREMKPYRLPIICGRLELPVYEHHDAVNDALMCSGLFKFLNENDPDKTRLTASNGGNLKSHSKTDAKLTPEQLKLCELMNLLGGIIEDEVVSQEELDKLRESFCDYDMLNGLYPYEETQKLLNDFSVVDDNNRKELYDRTLEIIDIKQKNDFYDSPNTCVDFNGKTFRLTNIFFSGIRADIEKKIKSLGGNPLGGSNSDYLVIGGQMNYKNKFILYNEKMIKAYENKTIKKKGNKIIDEQTLMRSLEKQYEE